MTAPFSKPELKWTDHRDDSLAGPYRVTKRLRRFRAYISVPDKKKGTTWDRVDRVSHLTIEEAKQACEGHATSNPL